MDTFSTFNTFLYLFLWKKNKKQKRPITFLPSNAALFFSSIMEDPSSVTPIFVLRLLVAGV